MRRRESERKWEKLGVCEGFQNGQSHIFKGEEKKS